jgi:hypothetical protein
MSTVTENYPGELAMLRGLLGVVRAIAKHSDIDELRRTIAEFDTDESAAYAEAREKSSRPAADATPDFFQPGRTYRSAHTPYTAPELIITFRVEHVTRHPDRGHRRAIGWSRTGEPGATWHGDFRDEGEFGGWADVTDTTTGKDGA